MKSQILTLANQALESHAFRIAELTETFVDQRKQPLTASRRAVVVDTQCALNCLRIVASIIRDPAGPVLDIALATFKTTGIPPRPFTDQDIKS